MNNNNNNIFYSWIPQNPRFTLRSQQHKLPSLPLESLRTYCISASEKVPENDSPTSLLYKCETPSPSNSTTQKRSKFNSTETMFIEDILHRPDVDQLVRCMAKVISLKIKQNLPVKDKILIPIFEEKNYSSAILPRKLYEFSSNDREANSEEFLTKIFYSRKLPAECAIVAVVYIDKLIEVTQLTLHDGNWRIIVFIALLLANKVWAEYAVWNEDFLQVFSTIWLSIQAIYRVEREFLKYLSFDLNIKPSVYSKYYFEIRSYMEDLPFKPLDKILALKLAVKAQKRSKKEKLSSQSVYLQRCNSMDSFFWKTSSSHASLSFDQFRAVRKNSSPKNFL